MTFIRTATGIVTGTAPMWLFKLLERAPLGRTVRLGPEDRLAIEFADRCRHMSLTGQLKGVWSHLPNEVGGGSKNAGLRYAVAKAMGLVSGSPDYMFLREGGCLCLEAKRPKTDTGRAGTLNPEQVGYRDWCKAEGVPYHVFTTVQEALNALTCYGFLERALHVPV